MSKTFGLLGEKLGHSFSPLIHGYLGDYAYPLYEVPPAELDAFLRAQRFDGLNVTIPYKQAVMPHCRTLSEEARAIGSVNTILRDENGALHGHNTDGEGFRAMLRLYGIDPGGKKALVLGDGGSARTVRAALAGLGAREIVTISRRGENHYGNIDRHHDAELIVNTTPVGMFPHNGESPVDVAAFARLEGVCDLIYNPARTRLLLDAGRLGIPRANGLAMLVAQAEAASRLFLNSPARADLVEEILNAIAQKTRNIALIGMPGCGKSTVGQALAQRMGRPLADIDALIEQAAGKPIPAIFAEEGEAAFRRMETRVLAEEAKKSGVVIATGGGVVTQPENLDLLRQNSHIVYLQRDLAALSTAGRPLSQRDGIEALAQARLPLYEAWCDVGVAVDTDPKRTTEEVLEGFRHKALR